MRLINYGVGEISDRLSILALKILYASAAEKDTAHWRNEQAALLTKIAARTLNGSWFASYTELAAVNSAIWQGEVALREWRTQWKPTEPDSTGLRSPGEGYVAAAALTVALLGIHQQALNDRRAQLIEAINKEAGDFLGSEKLT